MKKILISTFLFVMAAGISLGIGACAQPQSLDVNTATIEDLDRLPKVDRQLASNIVSYRDANGPFATVEELLNVKGMDNERLQEIKPYVFIGWEPPVQIPE
ncbi:MAG: helix-hairpin-helix domain-containing protein [Deltaproteobacteria bacterium]|nr:helix-hairpin-helix domain-containing protein [Deltaproteobacteria bacterium]